MTNAGSDMRSSRTAAGSDATTCAVCSRRCSESSNGCSHRSMSCRIIIDILAPSLAARVTRANEEARVVHDPGLIRVSIFLQSELRQRDSLARLQRVGAEAGVGGRDALPFVAVAV